VNEHYGNLDFSSSCGVVAMKLFTTFHGKFKCGTTMNSFEFSVIFGTCVNGKAFPSLTLTTGWILMMIR
jgi:hypothetical protein